MAKRTYDRGLSVPHLEYWRQRRALTQNELAEHASVARSTIVRGEAGGKIAAASVRRLAEFLGIRPEDLTDIHEAPTQPLPVLTPEEAQWEAYFDTIRNDPLLSPKARETRLKMAYEVRGGLYALAQRRRIHAEHGVEADTPPAPPEPSLRDAEDPVKKR